MLADGQEIGPFGDERRTVMDDLASVSDMVSELRKTGIGIWMTIMYAVIYGGFVAVSVFQPSWMSVDGLLGMNLALTYGIGLIVVAVAFAMVYNYLVRIRVSSATTGGSSSIEESSEQEQ
jgi:uncharacterized membrane protein (DUF485 family)